MPNPSNNATEGPVGTNITLTASGLTASDTYQLGYAQQAIGCSAGFQAFSGVSAATDSNGAFTATISWPASLANVGTSYYICAQDASNSQAQSQATFKVDAAQPPAITVKPVAGPTPAAGTPALPTDGYYPGSTVEIDGTSFLPGGVQLTVYLSTQKIEKQSDLTNATILQSVDGQQITSQGSGQATATVQIPSSVQPGSYYLYLVSSDSQANALPSLMAEKRVTITNAPTPTATVAPTSTPKGAITPPTSPSGPSHKKLAALFGLGALSVILFIVGVILLASAAGMPTQPGQQPSQPGQLGR